MSGSAIVAMIVMCGIVWGGFLGFLVRALRHESMKQQSERASTDG